jgi:hypothetical protein
MQVPADLRKKLAPFYSDIGRPSIDNAERALQASWWQEHGAAHARGPRAQHKLETRALFAGSQGGTVAPAGGNTCAPRSARLDLKTGIDAREGCRAQPVQGADRPLRPYGSAHVRPGLAMDTNYSD